MVENGEWRIVLAIEIEAIWGGIMHIIADWKGDL